MRLLFIAHRIPYPPNKGDKIRSYNELAFLCRHFEVDLVCFVDNDQEMHHVAKLQKICRSVSAFRRSPVGKLLSLAGGFLRRDPLSVALYRHKGLRRKIRKLLAANEYHARFIFSGQMAQYFPSGELGKTVVDFCDVDSEKWSNYAERLPFYLSWLYRMEAARLLAFEKAATLAAKNSIFITPAELGLYRNLGGQGRFSALGNGVDIEFFQPRPGKAEDGRLLFTGAMDYFPNEEGVAWFAREVFPPLKARFPDARFVIAGRSPTSKVRNLASLPGIEVTGYVEDMRLEQARAHIVIVPLRIARGMQNKVLEAMACGKAVVTTPMAMGGIDAVDGRDLMIASTPGEFLAKLETLLRDPALVESMGKAARCFVLDRFNWEKNLSQGLLPLLRDPDRMPVDGPRVTA